MQFLFIDLALALLALLGYRALSLAGRHMSAVVSLEDRAMRRRRIGSTYDQIARPPKAALPKPAPREATRPKRAPSSASRPPTLHRPINFW